ncbi:NmrA family NAD(P)-binding protein [Dyadobacter sandarakinus]|uniref:NmrA family NAD(P)-binding protein n=1 Tax=Dyadobacter sandarakinus TaxID=2747268 RepID=A0ABX7I2U8_9BACT|nr:NmrA family NAD(P)-binding protein [Dyadobacter sandarakinus]QRR00043.1 NmrA family NAD(P)-binding protein [Dyadobacter sandarakinus]
MGKSILVAGATGNLGKRICRELVNRNADVSAIVRADTNVEKIEVLKKMAVSVIEVNFNSLNELSEVCKEKDCVVSALAGLEDVIIDLQTTLLNAAIQGGVKRFIPSDFCTDYNHLVPGENRNFDLRRRFKAYLDTTPIQSTSIFNGAFADILKYNTPILNLKDKNIAYWGEKSDWQLDFTTMDDTAAFTAEAALDDRAPRDLQIASFQISPNELHAALETTTGQQFKIYQLSSLEDFAQFIKKQRAENPAGENELYAKWQQAQYMYSMFSTHHTHLANQHYPNVSWTNALSYIRTFAK